MNWNAFSRGVTNLALGLAAALFFYTRPYVDLLPFLVPHRWLPGMPPIVPPLILLVTVVFWLWFRTEGKGGLFLAKVTAVLPVIITMSVPLVPDILFDMHWMLFTCALFFLAPMLLSVASPSVKGLTKGRKAGFVLSAWCASFSFLLFMFLLLVRGNAIPLGASFAVLVCSLVLVHFISGGKRRFVLKLLVIASVVPLLTAVGRSYVDAGRRGNGSENDPLRTAARILVGPYLQNLQKTSVTVLWETDVYLPGTVTVSKSKDALLSPLEVGWQRGEGQPHDTYEGPEAMFHEVKLNGLEKDTQYYYRVISNKTPGVIGCFRTASGSPAPFDFAVYGDSQEMFDWAECLVRNRHKDMCESILSDNPQPRFVVHVGDMTFLGNEHERWGREFFGRVPEFMRNTVVWPVLGNHELNAAWYFDYFSLPNADERYYYFDYGNSRFIVLAVEGYAVGHEYGPPTRTPMDPGSPQYEWLKKTLEDSQDKTWRFVFFHQSPLSSGLEGGYTPARTLLMPLFERYGVHVVFSGHDHTYEVSVKDNVAYVITGGGGGPVSLLQPDLRSNPYSRYFKGTWHHCRVHVGTQQVTVQAVDLKGRVFHSFRFVAAGENKITLEE